MASVFFCLPLHASCLALDPHTHTPCLVFYSIDKYVLQQVYLNAPGAGAGVAISSCLHLWKSCLVRPSSCLDQHAAKTML